MNLRRYGTVFLLVFLLGSCGGPFALKGLFPGSKTDIEYSWPTVCSSISMPGDIEYYFSRPVYCGVFATGEWWVSPVDASGFQITNILPALATVQAQNGMTLKHHGYMVDPSPRIMVASGMQPPNPPFYPSLRNAFDNRGGSWVEPQAFPISISGNLSEPVSVVKAVSANTGDHECTVWINGNKTGTCIKRIGILTVMPHPQDYSGFFRPHPYRTRKSPFAAANSPEFSAPKIAYPAPQNWNFFLNLPPPSFTTINTALASNPCGRQGHFWFGFEQGAAQFHPTDCSTYYGGGGGLPTGYHAYLPFPWLFLRAMHSDAAPHRPDMLYSTFQYAIDLQAVMQSGYEPILAGGHHVGFKYLIFLTGHALGIPEMRNVGQTYGFAPSNPANRIFGDDFAYDKWDSRVGQMIPTYGGSCGLTTYGSTEVNAYVANILNTSQGGCESGPKGCEAVPSSLLQSFFSWFRDPTQHATDGGCVHVGNAGRPHRSSVDQFLDWTRSGTPADDYASYQSYFSEFATPYLAIIWKKGLQESYNYAPSLKYAGRMLFCDPWRAKRPTSTWDQSNLYYHNWFLDQHVANPYECPQW